MSNFKSKKIDFKGKNAYLYRDFIILNDFQFFANMQRWVVNFANGKTVYQNGNGTKREMMEWVDEYYQEMNDFVNSQQFNEMGETK